MILRLGIRENGCVVVIGGVSGLVTELAGRWNVEEALEIAGPQKMMFAMIQPERGLNLWSHIQIV